MMTVLGREVSVVACSNKVLVGLKGLVALESFHTLTIVSLNNKVMVPKLGTVLQLEDGRKIVLGDEMEGRIEDRLARGAKV